MVFSADHLSDILENERSITPYGIQFLDDALLGISRNELIVIGAGTGFGKTELLTNIALNASKTKRVVFFALEAEKREITHRLIYKQFSEDYFALKSNLRPPIKVKRMNYQAYRLGRLGDAIIPLILAATDKVERQISNLQIIYAEDLTIEVLIEFIEGNYNNYDLWLIDHLHYFEWDDELEGVRHLMKAIRKIGTKREVPIILASHLRKKDKYSNDFPEISELHGSSEISKRATTIIFLGEPKNGKFELETDKKPTIFHIAKCRHDGSLRHFYGLHFFDHFERKYSPHYFLLELKGKEFEAIQEIKKMPHWSSLGRVFPVEVQGYGK